MYRSFSFIAIVVDRIFIYSCACCVLCTWYLFWYRVKCGCKMRQTIELWQLEHQVLILTTHRPCYSLYTLYLQRVFVYTISCRSTSLSLKLCYLRCGLRGLSCARHITLDWIGLHVTGQQKINRNNNSTFLKPECYYDIRPLCLTAFFVTPYWLHRLLLRHRVGFRFRERLPNRYTALYWICVTAWPSARPLYRFGRLAQV